jgi:hypothetical protein
MKLDHTIIVPSDNYSLAKKLLNSLIYEEDVLVVIVMGEDELSNNAVKCADKRAQAVVAGFARKVAWIRSRTILEKEIKQITAGKKDISKENLSNVVAFSVSIGNKVADIVYTKDEISFSRMEIAFLEAGTK